MRSSLLWLTTALGACAGGDVTTDVDDTDTAITAPCAWSSPPVVEFARDVTMGLPEPGTPIQYGKPPQGGAPFAPFEVRLHATYDTSLRIAVTATATEVGSGALLGSIVQPQVFLCANAGPHLGWLYGGEVHVRFPDLTLEELEGRMVQVTVEVALPDGQAPASATTTGVLDWVLGPGAPADANP